MKMFTRLAAMMILAAMSLSLFTACGVEDWLNEQTGAEAQAAARASGSASSAASSTSPAPVIPVSSSSPSTAPSETTAPSEEKKDEDKPADKEEEQEEEKKSDEEEKEQEKEEEKTEEETSKIAAYFKNYTGAYSYKGTIIVNSGSEGDAWVASSGTSAYANVICDETYNYWFRKIAKIESYYYFCNGGRDVDWYKDEQGLAYLKETFRFYDQIFRPNTSSVVSGTDGSYDTETISGTRFNTPVKITYYFSGSNLEKIDVVDENDSGVYCRFSNFTLSPTVSSELSTQINTVKTNADANSEKADGFKQLLASYSRYAYDYTYSNYYRGCTVVCDNTGEGYIKSNSAEIYKAGGQMWKREGGYGDWSEIEGEDKSNYKYLFEILANVFTPDSSVQYSGTEAWDNCDTYKKNNIVTYYVGSSDSELKKIVVEANYFGIEDINEIRINLGEGSDGGTLTLGADFSSISDLPNNS